MEFPSPVYTPSKHSRLSLSRVKKIRRETQGKENNINESVQAAIEDKNHNFIVKTRPIESSNDLSYHYQEEEEEESDKIQFHVELNGDAVLSSSSSSSECDDDSQVGSFHDSSDQQSVDLEFTACHPSDNENDVYDDEQLEEDRKPAHEKETTHVDSDDDDELLKPSPWAKSKASKQRNVFLLEDESDNEDLKLNNRSTEETQGGTVTIHYGLRSPPPYPRNILSKPKNSPVKSPILKDYIESSSDEDLELSITKVATKITPKSSGKKKKDGSNQREIICLDDDSEDDDAFIRENESARKRSERQSLMPQHWGSSGMKKRSNVSTSFSSDLRRKPISLSDINYSRNDLTGGSGLGLGGVQVLKGGARYAENDDSDNDDPSVKKSKESKSKRSRTARKASTKTKSKRKRSKSSFKRRRSGGYKAAGRSGSLRTDSGSDWNVTQQGIRPYNGEETNNTWARGRQRGTRLGEVNLDPRLGNLGGATIQF